jgi:hypothetical protein
MYKNACATLSNTFVSVGQVGINFSPFGEPASRFTSAIERREMEEGKIATAWAQFATERSPSMYIRMRVLPWSNTLLAWGCSSISALW